MFRCPKLEDSLEIIQYYNKIGGETDFHTFAKNEYSKDKEQQEHAIGKYLSKDNSLMIICEYDDEIIGILSLEGGNHDRNRHRGDLGITVLQEYWGYGIGTNFMSQLFKWAAKINYLSKINLLVHCENIRAIKFYEKLGFEYEGVTKQYFECGGIMYDGIYMGKEI